MGLNESKSLKVFPKYIRSHSVIKNKRLGILIVNIDQTNRIIVKIESTLPKMAIIFFRNISGKADQSIL